MPSSRVARAPIGKPPVAAWTKALSVVLVSTQRSWYGGEGQARLLALGLRQRGHRCSILARRRDAFAQRMADETRWSLCVEQEAKIRYRCWFWAFLSKDPTAFRIEPTRSHDVPEGHYAKKAKGVLTFDRYSAYKAMAQVKAGTILPASCRAHVRRDFIGVGKGWPELVDWAERTTSARARSGASA